MFTMYLFILSGIAIAALIAAKMWEEKRRKPLFLLKAISRGDKRVRDLYHRTAHFYADSKDKSFHYMTKRLPMESRRLSNKAASIAKERMAKYIGDIRNSKYIKRSDGLSEFFKNIAESEREKGEINDIFDDSQNP